MKQRESIMMIFQYSEVRNICYIVMTAVFVGFAISIIKNSIIAILIGVVSGYFMEKWFEKYFPISNQNSNYNVNQGIRLGELVVCTLGLFGVSWVFPVGSAKWWVIIALSGLLLWLTIRRIRQWRSYANATNSEW